MHLTSRTPNGDSNSKCTETKPAETLGMWRTRSAISNASMIALLVFFAALTASCGADKVATFETIVLASTAPPTSNISGIDDVATAASVTSVGPEYEGNYDDDRVDINADVSVDNDAADVVPAAVNEPAEGSGSEELVRVPDVVGLSTREAQVRLETAGFDILLAPRKVSQPDEQHDTIGSMFPAPGTPRPFGSMVVLDIYYTNLSASTGPDSPEATEEIWDRTRIAMQLIVEFGDRLGHKQWDETTATLHFKIVDLSIEEIGTLQDRYADEAFTVTFSPGAIGIGQLEALNQSISDLIHRFGRKCGVTQDSPGALSSVGINLISWSVEIGLSPEIRTENSTEVCAIIRMKQSILSMAADFVKEHSIPADPADLVQFREGGPLVQLSYPL